MINSKETERKITNHLQKDVVKISGQTIFINPFLYWRRFDENTNRWLREPGQMSEDQIHPNRNRFYPEIDWEDFYRVFFLLQISYLNQIKPPVEN